MTVNPTGNLKPITTKELNAHSEQALVELIYIQTANNILGSALTSLSNALNTTQSVLSILTELQNMHNDVIVSGKPSFSFNFTTGGVQSAGGSLNITRYESAYNAAASAYFGQAIDPSFMYASSTAAGFKAFASSLLDLRKELGNEISVLTKETPKDTRSDPNNLLNTVRTVYNELPSTKAFSSVKKWALDHYDSQNTDASEAGNIQNDLTTAITAAESLNDTQKEDVRSFLFTFQQYYQSASAVLSSINQLMTSIAQNIAPQ